MIEDHPACSCSACNREEPMSASKPTPPLAIEVRSGQGGIDEVPLQDSEVLREKGLQAVAFLQDFYNRAQQFVRDGDFDGFTELCYQRSRGFLDYTPPVFPKDISLQLQVLEKQLSELNEIVGACERGRAERAWR